MTNSAAVSCPVQPDVSALKWLAWSLTSASGSMRGHRLVQDFDGVDRLCRASLTELKVKGLLAVSVQSIPLGKSQASVARANLTATWEDVWEELSAEIKVQLEAGWQVESSKPAEASLFADLQLSPHQQRINALLQPDEATQLDEILERPKGEISSSEIFPLGSN